MVPNGSGTLDGPCFASSPRPRSPFSSLARVGVRAGDPAPARRDLRDRRAVHAARAGSHPHRARPEARRPLPPAPGALERDDHRAGDADRDAAAPLDPGDERGASTATSSRWRTGGRAGSSCGTASSPALPTRRSSAGVTLDGLLDVRRVKYFGTWRGTGQRRPLNRLNKAPVKNGMSLFTPDWGRRRRATRAGSPSSSRRPRRRRRTWISRHRRERRAGRRRSARRGHGRPRRARDGGAVSCSPRRRWGPR